MTETATAAVAASEASPAQAEVTEQAVNETQDNVEAKEEQTPEAEVPDFRKFKHKVALPDGEFEVDYDELTKNYAKNKVLTQREQENAKLRKEAQQEKDKLAQFLEAAKNDPNLIWQLAQQLGHDPEKLAILRAREAFEWEKKSEHEKKAIVAERELEKARERLKEIDDAKMQEEKDFYAQRIEQEVESDILAVVKELGQDVEEADIETIAQITSAMYASKESKPTPQEIAKAVRERSHKVSERYLKSLLKAGQVESLPKEILNALQKHYVDKAKASSKIPTIPPSPRAASGSNKDSSKKTGVDKWFKSLGR